MSPTSVVSCFLITVLAGAALGDAVKDIAKVKLRARRNLVDTEPLLYYLSVDTGKAYMTPLSDDELRKYYYDLDKENGGGGDWAYFKDLGKRYKLFHIKMTFDEAKKACKLLGERILNIEYIMWGREVAFLSGKFMSKDEPEYWMFREALSDRDPSTSYCDVFVPSKKMSKNNYKTLSKDQCNEKKYFICEKVDRVQIGG
ncbi:unnamed protein product [Heligmosomoides polygyrus]|uniref:C-type lectin domain-containing protein n=1 Tax=Heligmosomoides polygyrus TaxID=6339 RepID=A0A183FMN1_HELPZ|nr:unnamed protein product [Heligmosomoides polygyrus]